MINKLYPDGNNFIGEAKILDTPYGKIVKNSKEKVNILIGMMN